jgi:hypothetical protein
MRKFYLLLMLSPLIVVGILKLIGTPMHHKPKAAAETGNPQALLMIFDGDKVDYEVFLKDRTVFIVKPDGIGYADTAQPGTFYTGWSDLSKIGEGQRKQILKRMTSVPA